MLDSVAPAPDESRPVARFEHVVDMVFVFFQGQVVPTQRPAAHTPRILFRVVVQLHEGKQSLSQDGHDDALPAEKLISVRPRPAMAVQDVHNGHPHTDLLMGAGHGLSCRARSGTRTRAGERR
ncbi:hypothetical protein ACIBK9_49690 [Nonomuraea sp. NPDC050227]|uniref:hypothetical protein n=1 Tax=Nonomuraea sp. NPDC050227 TaxID=3364360 RepID=UPI00378DB2CB